MPDTLANPSVRSPLRTADTGADWWKGAVIYQIYPRSFQDTNGDGIGDLPGIIKRLPYLADLGVDAIWLSPFFTSPMKDFGYDVSNYCDVDAIFGTLRDFEALTTEAHRLGLKVIIDQVISHTSDVHPWFVESRRNKTNPKADWYVWADAAPDGTAPTNWLSVFGGPAWEWDSRRCQYYMHNFLTSQPDLNFHNEEVQAAVLDVLKFWLELGVDGFRLDTVNYYFHDKLLRSNPPAPNGPSGHDAPAVNPYGRQDHIYDKNQPENLEFLKKLRAVLDAYPGAASMGEVGDGARALQIMADYTSGGDKLHMCYTFDLLGEGYGADYFRDTIAKFEGFQGAGWPCWAFSNHDVPRWASRFLPKAADPLRQRKLVSALLMSFRGSVCLYEGEELGLTEANLAYEDLVDPYGIRFWPEFKGRDGCRTPMVWEADAPNAGFSTGKPWLPVPAEHAAVAVDRQTGAHDSVLEHYRRLLAFRRGHEALKTGTIRFLPSEGDLLVFERSGDGETLLCAFNFSHDNVRYRLPAGAKASLIGRELGFTGLIDGDAIVLFPEDACYVRLG